MVREGRGGLSPSGSSQAARRRRRPSGCRPPAPEPGRRVLDNPEVKSRGDLVEGLTPDVPLARDEPADDGRVNAGEMAQLGLPAGPDWTWRPPVMTGGP